MTRSKLRRLIGEFVEVGGAALQVVSGSHSRDDSFPWRYWRDFGLLASAGSDYHGPEHPWIELGQASLPDGCGTRFGRAHRPAPIRNVAVFQVHPDNLEGG